MGERVPTPQIRLHTRQFGQVADVPPEIECRANITKPRPRRNAAAGSPAQLGE